MGHPMTEKVFQWLRDQNIDDIYTYVYRESCVRLSRENASDVIRALERACARLGCVEVPEIYLIHDYDRTIEICGIGRPFLLVSSFYLKTLKREGERMMAGILGGAGRRNPRRTPQGAAAHLGARCGFTADESAQSGGGGSGGPAERLEALQDVHLRPCVFGSDRGLSPVDPKHFPQSASKGDSGRLSVWHAGGFVPGTDGTLYPCGRAGQFGEYLQFCDV